MFRRYNTGLIDKMATVSAVDEIRKTCKCIGDDGDTYTDVHWISPVGSDAIPNESDRVLISLSTGYPIILGSFPSFSSDDARRQNIDKQDVDPTAIANYSIVEADEKLGNTPQDLRVGDKIISNDYGLFGLLRMGSFIAKASSYAQIFASRFNDVVKIVSRNYDHYSDMDSYSKNSIRGKLYSKKEIYRDLETSRSETPFYTEYTGDVPAAEAIEQAADGQSVSPRELKQDVWPTIPADDGTYFKSLTEKDKIKTTEILKLDGERNLKIESDTHSVEVINKPDGFQTKLLKGSDEVSITGTDSALDIVVKDVTINLTAAGAMTVTAKGNVAISSDGDVAVTSKGKMDLTADGNVGITSKANMTFTAKKVDFNKG